MAIDLIIPSAEHEAAAEAFKNEFYDNGETVINGSEMLDCIDSYPVWLDKVTMHALENASDDGWVRTDTFFAADDSGRIVGIIDLRHELKGFLADFGNVGFSVRPTERRKGYATAMLGMLKEKAKNAGLNELNISVERGNIPSVRTIVKNGGMLKRTFDYNGEPADIYLIKL